MTPTHRNGCPAVAGADVRIGVAISELYGESAEVLAVETGEIDVRSEDEDASVLESLAMGVRRRASPSADRDVSSVDEFFGGLASHK